MFSFIVSPSFISVMPELSSPAMLAFCSLLVTSVAAPLVQGYLTRKQLKLQAELQAETQAETHRRLDTVQSSVETVDKKADAAYHVANNVNEWREQLTTDLNSNINQVKAFTQDTNRKVDAAVRRPPVPPLIILSTPVLSTPSGPAEAGKKSDSDKSTETEDKP